MILNHLDLPVTNIQKTKAFFETYFSFKCIFERADGLTVLLDKIGFALTLSLSEHEIYPNGFHLGFMLRTEKELLDNYEKFLNSDVKIVRKLGILGEALTFQILAPENILVELSWRDNLS